jgi:dolichyl-diphosphooligosaccharide--protein glycosyltransferase
LNRAVSAFLLVLGLLVPIAAGLWVRFDDAKVWEKKKSSFFLDGKPLFTSYDAFYFAIWSKEYLRNNYRPGELYDLSFVPDRKPYPDPIPMESWLAAKLSSLFSVPIEWVAFYLTPILAVLMVVPLYIFFHRLKLPLAGLGGALLGVISFSYLIRTSICRFDTDSLNLFFPFSIALSLYLSLKSSGRWRYFWAVSAGLLAQLYYWWYLHSGLIFVFIPFYLAALYLERELPFSEKRKLFLIFFVSANPVILLEGVFNLMGSVKSYLINFFKPQVLGFPNIQKTVSELRHFELYKLANWAAGSFLLFALGLGGLILLYLRKWKDLVLFTPILLIGLISFIGGNRFIMYLAPFVGLGFGYLFDRLYRVKERAYLLPLFALIVVGAIFYSARNSINFVAAPKLTSTLAGNFAKLSSLTPEGSWIWSWWDFGTAIIYYGDRATYHDPQSAGTPKTYFVAKSMVDPSSEVAYNAILGVSNLGAEGIEEAVEAGKPPAEITREILSGKYSKPIGREIYWLFTGDTLNKFVAISSIGNWNFQAQKGKPFVFITGGCVKRSGEFFCSFGRVSLKKLLLVLKNRRSVPLFLALETSKGGKPLSVNSKKKDKGLVFEAVNMKGNFYIGFVMDRGAYRSNFNRMFVLRKFDPDRFELVYDDFPSVVLYRVKQR